MELLSANKRNSRGAETLVGIRAEKREGSENVMNTWSMQDRACRSVDDQALSTGGQRGARSALPVVIDILLNAFHIKVMRRPRESYRGNTGCTGADGWPKLPENDCLEGL